MISDLILTDATEAAHRLRAGGVVAIPTETVYGLAAAVDHPAAIARIFRIKGRPTTHPLILHLADPAQLPEWVLEIPPDAARLAAWGWPGPLTLLLRRSARVPDLITGGRDTVAVRVPAHPLARAVLADAGPCVAPSANTFGHVSPTTAAHVLDDLTARLDEPHDGVLDGGPCEVGVESTIIDCTTPRAQILRPGGISTEEIHTLLEGRLEQASGPDRASGMLPSHYAPGIPVVLCETTDELDLAVATHQSRGLDVMVIGPHVVQGTADLAGYARDLYSLLRRAETEGRQVIIALLPPAEGLGHALRDRLRKAAAPRP